MIFTIFIIFLPDKRNENENTSMGPQRYCGLDLGAHWWQGSHAQPRLQREAKHAGVEVEEDSEACQF